MKVVAAVALSSVVEDYEAAFRDAGYSPGVLLPSMLAALGAADAQRPTLVVKVDARTTSIAILDQEQLLLFRTLENTRGVTITGEQLAEEVYPSVVFFQDTYHLNIEQIFISGLPQLGGAAPVLRGPLFGVHVSSLLFAYASFALACVIGITYVLLFKEIKAKHLGFFYARLPSLQVLDRMNQRAIMIGWIFLTVGIIAGAVWAGTYAGPDPRVHAMSLQDPKIFVALVCWAVYSFELFAARRIGWGGRRAAYLSAIGVGPNESAPAIRETHSSSMWRKFARRACSAATANASTASAARHATHRSYARLRRAYARPLSSPIRVNACRATSAATPSDAASSGLRALMNASSGASIAA